MHIKTLRARESINCKRHPASSIHKSMCCKTQDDLNTFVPRLPARYFERTPGYQVCFQV